MLCLLLHRRHSWQRALGWLFVFSILITTCAQSYNRSVPGGDCKQVRQRREWRQLTELERHRFLTTVRVMQSQQRPTVYDKLARVHLDYRNATHGTWAFMAFHRVLILTLESELRKIDPALTLPYWDW